VLLFLSMTMHFVPMTECAVVSQSEEPGDDIPIRSKESYYTNLSDQDKELVNRLTETVATNGGEVAPVLTIFKKEAKESDSEASLNDFSQLRYWDDFGILGTVATVIRFINRLLHVIFNPPSNGFTTVHLAEQPWIWLYAALVIVFHQLFHTEDTKRRMNNPNWRLSALF